MRVPTSLPALVFAWSALVIIVMWPYFFGGVLIGPGADTISQYYPAFYWYSEVLRAGDSLLWDPQMFSGFPTYLSQISGYFEPLNFALFSLIPSFLFAYHVRLGIDYVLVMVFAYLAARTWGISRNAAFLVGPAYLMSFHWWYLSNTVIANSLFLLPFLFWVYRKASDATPSSSKLWWALCGGIGVGWAFLGGYAQYVVYALVMIGLYAVLEFFLMTDRAQRTIRAAAERAVVLFMFAAVGALVASPIILAALSYSSLSVREGGIDYALTQFKVLEPQEIIYFLFPDYLRFPLLTGGKKTLFIGAIFFLTALLAFGYIRRMRVIAVMSILFAFALVMSVPSSPLYYAFHQLPVFEMFRFPYRWMYLGVFVLTILAALGFDALREVPRTRFARVLAWGSLGGASLAAVFVGLATFAGDWFWNPFSRAGFLLFETIAYSPDIFPKGLEHYAGAIDRAVSAIREVVILWNLPFTIPFLSLLASCAVFSARILTWITYRYFRVYVTVLMLATFVGIFVARWPDSPSADVFSNHRASAGDTIPAADMLLWRAHPFNLGQTFIERIPPMLTWNTQHVLAGIEYQFATAAPNDHRFAGLHLTDGYDVFAARDLVVTLGALGGNYAAESELVGVPIEERIRRLYDHLDVVGMMAGRYIISGTPLSHPDLTLLATPVASRFQLPYYIYENAAAVPRVRVTDQIRYVAHSSVSALMAAGVDFREAAYVDCDACNVSVAEGASVELLESANGYFRLRVASKGGTWLIVSEQLIPGWHATLDDEPIGIIRANGMYMAIRIPEGEHEVVLQYEGIRGEAQWLYPLGLFPRPPLTK